MATPKGDIRAIPAGLSTDQRLRVMRMAMSLEQGNGTDAVLSAFDRMMERICADGFQVVATDTFTASLVENFLEAEWVPVEKGKVQAKDFYERFRASCVRGGLSENEVPSMQRVGRVMRTTVQVHDSNVTYYLGIEPKEG
jgi:hypothetical protein